MVHKNKSEKEMVMERLNITIPKDTKDKLEKLAKLNHRSQSNMITILIEEQYEKQK